MRCLPWNKLPLLLVFLAVPASAQSYNPVKPEALNATSVPTAGTAVTALTPTQHLNGGWIQNCTSNSAGNLFVNDNGTATSTAGGSNAELGIGAIYNVPPGNQTISVNSDTSGENICGEGYN